MLLFPLLGAALGLGLHRRFPVQPEGFVPAERDVPALHQQRGLHIQVCSGPIPAWF
jgi:hypothetical protein